jgi:TRAP-type mannitol/chloroaromatic compound transport system permease small subunit
MQAVLRVSRVIDGISDRIGSILIWLVLAAVLVSATNAVIRKAFNIGSNAWLEMQWYLFAAVFLLGAGYAFLHNAHVRIDFISGKLSPQARNWIDVLGIVVFLAPLCYLIITLSWPLFVNAWNSGERSPNAGGLIRWPVLLLVPVGMSLLLAQAASELIKRIAFLRGLIRDPLAHAEPGEAHGAEAAKVAEAAK